MLPLPYLIRQSAFCALFFVSLSVIGSSAHALSAEAATEQVQAQLVAAVDAVHPGEKILLGVQQRIKPHWHTYWINPGDSGLSTKIAWDLPNGASAGAIQWPIPSRFQIGPVTNYGYENEVTLLSTITIPKDANVGSLFPIKAKVNWLVCQEICIPQQVELELRLPIVRAGGAGGHGSPLIAKARSNLPVNSPWPVHVATDKQGLSIRIASTKLQSANIKELWFYSDQWGKIAHGAPQPKQVDGDTVVLKLQPGEAPLAVGEALSGVLVVTESTVDGTVARGFTINTAAATAVATAVSASNETTIVVPATTSAPSTTSSLELASALLLALLGGVILNLMPCVFPVLSIKALSLLHHAHQTRLQTRLHGLVYTFGVLASFALLGVLLIALKAGGAQIGWGFQFQSPLFVLAVAYLMFAVGLSLSGVFSIGGSIAGIGSSLAERSGYSGSFFTGVLATIVATPCTAPFMGSALGYALTQPPAELMAIFLSLGFGLALPFLLLSIWPLLQRSLPRPGMWMERVKQGLAFPMYATAAWLIWVLAQQAGVNAIAIALGGIVLIAFAAWLFDITRIGSKLTMRSGAGVAAVAVIGALAGGYVGINANPANASQIPDSASAQKNWTPYTVEHLQTLRAKGEPVFVNFTAAWCITCLVNEQVALSESSVVNAFKKAGIHYLKGDWTNQDLQITGQLAKFGRSGVPLYIFYPHGIDASPVVLPQLLTPEIVLTAVNTAPSSHRINY